MTKNERLIIFNIEKADGKMTTLSPTCNYVSFGVIILTTILWMVISVYPLSYFITFIAALGSIFALSFSMGFCMDDISFQDPEVPRHIKVLRLINIITGFLAVVFTFMFVHKFMSSWWVVGSLFINLFFTCATILMVPFLSSPDPEQILIWFPATTYDAL